MTLGIASLFDDPFFTGINSSPLVPRKFPVAIGGHPYAIDVTKYQRRTIPALRQAADLTVEPGEGSLAIQGTWSRSAKTWWHGAGQLRFDSSLQTGGVTDREQYYLSEGLNPWVSGELALQNTTASAYSHALSSPTNKLLTTNAGVYWILGTTLYLLTGATLGTRTTITGTPGTAINDITTDGTSIYIATASGIYSGVLGGATVAVFGAATATQAIGYCNGFLLAGRGVILGTVSGAGVFTALLTHYSTAFLWSQIGSGGNHIYALGGADTFTELYKTSIIDATGALNIPSLATVLPSGEKILCFLAYVNAAVILGTSLGIRVAASQADGTLDYGPVVTEPGPVSSFTADGDFIWFGWNQLAVPDALGVTTTKPAVGRLSLGHSTASLVAAYASDVAPFNVTTVDNVTTCVVMGIARYLGKTLFVENHSGGGNLWLEGTTQATTGWFNTGWINYSIIEKKVFIDLVIRHPPLLTGQSVDVYYITEASPIPVYLGSSALLASTEAIPMVFPALRVNRIQLLFVLKGTAIKITSWWIRAIPAPRRVEEIVVPVILETQVASGGGDGLLSGMDTLTEFQFIAALAAYSVITTYQEGTQTYTVVVSDYEIKEPTWNPKFTFFDTILLVTLTTVI